MLAGWGRQLRVCQVGLLPRSAALLLLRQAAAPVCPTLLLLQQMTYVKQLEEYEEAVMRKRLEEMPEGGAAAGGLVGSCTERLRLGLADGWSAGSLSIGPRGEPGCCRDGWSA